MQQAGVDDGYILLLPISQRRSVASFVGSVRSHVFGVLVFPAVGSQGFSIRAADQTMVQHVFEMPTFETFTPSSCQPGNFIDKSSDFVKLVAHSIPPQMPLP